MDYKSEFLKICENLDEDKKVIADRLCEEAAFMAVTLDKLKAEINETGATIKTKNGNGFDVVMEAPAQKSYNTMVKNYNATLKGLSAIIAETETDENPIIKKLKKR